MAPSRPTEKVVVLLSGGMDSTTLLYDVIDKGYDVRPISFDYGQKHDKELEAAHRTCKKLGIPRKVASIHTLGNIAPSALTQQGEEIPKGHYTEDTMKQTVVPNRNMVLISLAAAYTISIGAKQVWYGAHGGDHAIYPDCREIFVFKLAEVLGVCDWDPISLVAPYLYWDKIGILKKGLELSVDYSLTWTCYEGKELACGKCGSCNERLEAFKSLGIVDPIKYVQDYEGREP